MNEDAGVGVSGNDFGDGICDKGSGMILGFSGERRNRVNVDGAAGWIEVGGEANPLPRHCQMLLSGYSHSPRDSIIIWNEMVVADIRSQRGECFQRYSLATWSTVIGLKAMSPLS